MARVRKRAASGAVGRRPAKAKAPAARETPARQAASIEVRTPNAPAHRGQVDRERYQAMKKALLALLPRKAPGLTYARMLDAAWQAVPRALFPTAGQVAWWVRCVQLDLEARGALGRLPTTPLQWVRLAGKR